jgi:transcriptional regulator with XRE-family HTH domain
LSERGWPLARLRRAVEEEAKIHPNTWSNWRAKRTIMKIDDLERIARALNVPAASLLMLPDSSDAANVQLSFEFDWEELPPD